VVVFLFVLLVGPFFYAIFYPALTGTNPQTAADEAFLWFYSASPYLTILVWVVIGYYVYTRFLRREHPR